MLHTENNNIQDLQVNKNQNAIWKHLDDIDLNINFLI